ncbi:MAG: hypothetical protein ACOYBX_11900 [Mycobacterium sp.]
MDYKALGHGAMIQFTWIYEHDVDLVTLRRFHHGLGKGLLGRSIERSPLPFGRSRWVAWSPPAGFDVAEIARPRSELTAWADEQAALPISPEGGPPWRMAVQPLVEGGAAVTLVVAHVVADGVGLNNAVADAVNGTGSRLEYPAPHSRTKIQALYQDARQSLRDLPRTARALMVAPLAAKEVPLRLRPAAGTSLVRRDQSQPPALRVTDLTLAARLPSLTVLVDTQHWDERAESLGGTSNSLLIGFTARLCGLLGWVDSDGLADLMIPVNEREPGDTRGNALTSAALMIDPVKATDLRMIRAAVKASLTRLSAVRDRILAPLALTPFVPNFVANRLQTVLQRSASITCSHFGNLDPAVNRPDGTEADWFFARHARTPDMADPALLRRVGGIFFPIASGRLGGRIYVSVCYSNAEGSTTTDQLSGVVQTALDDFGITAHIE